jgi:RHS repeat-associated protein
MAYDVLDRNVRTTLPDASFTTIAYGFGQDRGGLTQFETTVRDGNVNAGQPGAIKSTYRDVRELITGVKELNQGSVLWTSYAYDALKQIAKVVDDKFNTTTVAYDHLGRRTAIDNPDTGKTETHYDLAGNLTRRITANLRAAGQAIAYAYDFNRLKSITYPVNTGNNITYTYGAPGSPGNAAGRLTRITSQMGTEERAYGKLGEVVYEKKTVVTFTTPNAPEVYETRYRYDPFGRLLKLTYPDGEVLTYAYDSGGNLKSAEGVKGSPASGGTYRYGYLKNLSYDKFESRVLLEAGNSVKTAYKYDPKTRRLANLTAGKGAGNLFQNLLYTYDLVGNVLGLANDVPVPPPSQYGGPTTQTFAYDELYRLTKAQGTYQYAPNKTHTYSLDLAYDTIHNLTQKTQVHYLTQPSGVPIPQKKTSYDWAYTYSPSGPNSVRPHAPIHIGERTFGYDLNGNQLGWTHDQNGTRRTIVWDEENRIQSLFDSGHEKTYKYDDQGNRVIKRGPQGETVYVNQFYTQRPGATGTKNVYAGTTRLTSKLVKQETPGSNPAGKTPYEKDLYFYHPDHLGTSNYITDTNGRLYEHLEYFPFGEAWVEENSNTQRTPYLFTAKELDEETGLYYFGARYYDPRTSVWQSADPILNQYLDGKRGMGGVFAPQNLALYSYTWNNPVKYADPDGKAIWVPIFIGIGLYLSDVKPANAPGPSDVPTSESVSMAPQDLAVEAVKQVAPESTHTAIDVVSTVGNPKKAIQGAGDLVRNVSSGPLKTKSGNVEAAASAARTQPHNTPVLTEHAKKRMEQRGVSQSRVEEAATHGDIVGNRGPVVERHMPASRSESGRGTTVTQDVRTNRVTTVIDKGSQD